MTHFFNPFTAWSEEHGRQAQGMSEEDMRRVYLPQGPRTHGITCMYRFNRLVFRLISLNGFIPAWHRCLKGQIVTCCLGFFTLQLAAFFTRTEQRVFYTHTETFSQAVEDSRHIWYVFLFVMLVLILNETIPTFIGSLFYESDEDALRYHSFQRLMGRKLAINPSADLHSLDYDCSVNPIQGYLWYLDLDYLISIAKTTDKPLCPPTGCKKCSPGGSLLTGDTGCRGKDEVIKSLRKKLLVLGYPSDRGQPFDELLEEAYRVAYRQKHMTFTGKVINFFTRKMVFRPPQKID